jgi:phospholipase/carboxylesterase
MQPSPDFDVIRGFQIEGTDPPHRALIPNAEPVKHLLVLLHGYGADADDLFPLAMQLAPALPRTAIVSLEAPEEIPGGMFGGRQWFPISRIDNSELDHGAQMARGYVTTALTALKERFDLGWSDIALFGFSQGCMMALEVSLRLPEPIAYVLGYSGALPAPERAVGEATSKPPFLLVHGEEDQVVPFTSMEAAAQVLAGLGAKVETFPRPGLGHGIDGEGLQAALLKLREGFGMGALV